MKIAELLEKSRMRINPICDAEIQLRDEVILKLAQFAEAVEYDSMGMSGKAKECLTECEALLGGEK